MVEAGLPGKRSAPDAVRKAARYGIAAIGPIGAAGSQFLLMLQLLHMLEPAQFGAFSFLLVTSNFSNGVWSALFCAPLPVVAATGSDETRAEMMRSLFTTNLLVAAAAFLLFWALGWALAVPTAAAFLFAGYAAVALLRWFARSHAYLGGKQLRTTASDLTYSLLLFCGVVLIQFVKPTSLMLPAAVLCACVVCGLLPFGLAYLQRQFLDLSLRDVPRYGEVWRKHSGWSLLGVVTTEATANAHAYLVTLFLGPAAFAPLSASALPIRPISVVTNALTDFERPQMARQMNSGRVDLARRGVTLFRLALMAMWAMTAAAAWVLLAYAPHLVFPPRYDWTAIAIGTALWMAVALVRLLRQPDSVLLQAAGMFRPLAFASAASCGVSVVAVAGLLLLSGPLCSIAGILLGELVCAMMIWRQARRWLASPEAAPAPFQPNPGEEP